MKITNKYNLNDNVIYIAYINKEIIIQFGTIHDIQLIYRNDREYVLYSINDIKIKDDNIICFFSEEVMENILLQYDINKRFTIKDIIYRNMHNAILEIKDIINHNDENN